MNSPLFRIARITTACLALLGFRQASAQSGVDIRLTSNDGVTITARLVGWDGSHFLLERGARDYRVAPARLTPESCERARRILNLDPSKARLPQVARREQPVVDAPVPDLAAHVSRDESEPLPEPVAGPDDDRFGAVLPDRDDLPAAIPEPELSRPVPSSRIRLEGNQATAPSGIPSAIQAAVEAGNRLQHKAYKWGGGRARLEDSGYDCSGSVSYVLIKAGLLGEPGTSRSLMNYGEPGPGRWITIHARDGHVFMTICGLRLDTGGNGGRGENGPRWRPLPRGGSGFVMRHPPGL